MGMAFLNNKPLSHIFNLMDIADRFCMSAGVQLYYCVALKAEYEYI